MRFHITLVQHIYSKAVADVVDAGIVRIVGCTQSVDIEFFHQCHVVENQFGRQYTTVIWINLVTVDPTQYDRGVVDIETCDAFGVFFKLHFAESDFRAFHLHRLSICIFQ